MQLAVNIVVLAAIYALIACGYVLIYRVSRVLNLAHGELMMLGAYLLIATAASFAGHPLMAIAAAVVLSILLRGLIVLIWSAQQRYPGQDLGLPNMALALPGGARISIFVALLVA